ncbi:MAG TPA: LLM class F420-dependent oxidoreductase [Methylomirabilota bacterium]
MEFGCHLPVFGPAATRAGLLTFAREMERLGYDSLWASDHIVIPHAIRSRYPYSDTGQFPLAADATFLEPLTALAMVAGVTERVKLGTTVLVLPHRHPVLAAKMLSTLDHLSGGRVILGAGVGWMREEIELLGVPFDERGAWSDEAIRIMRACWRDERTRFHGRYFSFDDIGCFPKPVRGDIPIWMGGHSKPALRRIVALADGWHAAFPTAAGLEAGLSALREECARQKRPFDELSITLRAGLAIRTSPGGPDRRALQGTPEEIVADLRAFKALGVTHVLMEASYRDLGQMTRTFEAFARDIRPKV